MKKLYYVIRTILRGRSSNLIKVISLGLGLTMTILLFGPVDYEQSINTCYKDYDNLYQVFTVATIGGVKHTGEKIMGPMAGAILENFPDQVEAATCAMAETAAMPLYNGAVRFDDFKMMADSLFFCTMGIEVLNGDPERDLAQKDVIYLSDRFARKIFGGESPIGKTLKFGGDLDLIVKGTYAALPENATMKPEAVMSMPTAWSREWIPYFWRGGDMYSGYVRFKPQADKELVMSRIDAMIQKYLPDDLKEIMNCTALLIPIRDTYRNQENVKRMTYVMSILGLAILFIVSLNYVLISISSLSSRAKMVGVHKCNGAGGGTIFSMFLIETGIIILASIILMAFILFRFSGFVENITSIQLSELFAPEHLWVPLLVVLFLFIVGGTLPGRLFARIPVSQVFLRYTENKIRWKRPLLFVQFAGVAFICGLMCVVMSQYIYVTNKSMGYTPKNIANSSTVYLGSDVRRDAVCQFFRNLPYVADVSFASNTPIKGYGGALIRLGEASEGLFTAAYGRWMTNYPEMMGISLKEGHIGDNREHEVLVNETFAEWMNWGDDIIGRTFWYSDNKATVTGILNDFHIGSFHEDQKPFVGIYDDNFYDGMIQVRLKEPFMENLQKLNKESAEAFPDLEIDFDSMEQQVAIEYNSERIFKNVTILAAVTMFFTMLMGLTGYITDEVRRRSKEIAIRKVNGAEVSSILRLLSQDVFYVAFPAIAIGIVAAGYTNDIWIDQFSEKVSIGWPIYLLLAVANLAIIISCVLWRSWKIANENPVNSIKSE